MADQKTLIDFNKFDDEIEIIKWWLRKNKDVDTKEILKIINQLFDYISHLELENFELATKIINIEKYTKYKSKQLQKLLLSMAKEYRALKQKIND
jgi:hypothetical protein